MGLRPTKADEDTALANHTQPRNGAATARERSSPPTSVFNGADAAQSSSATKQGHGLSLLVDWLGVKYRGQSGGSGSEENQHVKSNKGGPPPVAMGSVSA